MATPISFPSPSLCSTASFVYMLLWPVRAFLYVSYAFLFVSYAFLVLSVLLSVRLSVRLAALLSLLFSRSWSAALSFVFYLLFCLLPCHFGPTTLSCFRRYLCGWVWACLLIHTPTDIFEIMIEWWDQSHISLRVLSVVFLFHVCFSVFHFCLHFCLHACLGTCLLLPFVCRPLRSSGTLFISRWPPY